MLGKFGSVSAAASKKGLKAPPQSPSSARPPRRLVSKTPSNPSAPSKRRRRGVRDDPLGELDHFAEETPETSHETSAALKAKATEVEAREEKRKWDETLGLEDR